MSAEPAPPVPPEDDDPWAPTEFGVPGHDEPMSVDYGFIPREDWDPAPPRSEEPLGKVTSLMTFETGGEECVLREDCLKLVKKWQTYYMVEKGLDDVPWNFLIGSDGNMYEGRGWKWKPIKPDLTRERQKQFDGKSIDIAFLGIHINHTRWGAHNATLTIIEEGMKMGIIPENVTLETDIDRVYELKTPPEGMKGGA